MNRRQLTILLCLISAMSTQAAYAGPIMYRVQQKKMMEERQQQLQIQQELEIQRHRYLIIQEQEVQPTYQQAVDHRNEAIAQAIQNAHHQPAAVPTVAAPPPAVQPSFWEWLMSMVKNFFGAIGRFFDGIIGWIWNKPPAEVPVSPEASVPKQPQAQSTVAEQQPQEETQEQTPAGQNTQMVDLVEVWKKLDQKSTIWTALADEKAKLLTVSEYISRFQKEGVKIKQPPLHYVQMIDQLTTQNPQMLQRPFGDMLQVLAIIEYDFDNGMNKDDLAKKVLGEAGFAQNKQRFLQQQQQEQQVQQQL